MPPVHISSLPTEILAEIFYQHIQAVNPGRIWESNTILCRVSRQWKAVAQSHARLWSTIYIEFASMEPPPPIEILELWLERSGRTPLEICFSHTIDNYPLGSQLLDCLVLHIHRWKRFTSIGSCMLELVNAIPFDEAHQLEFVSFTLYRYYGCGGFDENKLISTLASAPYLHTLHLDSNFPRVVQLLVMSSPWESLTDVFFSLPMSMSEMLRIMHSCPSATKMFISSKPCEGEYQGTYNPSSIVTLPSLRTLHLSIYAIGYGIFNHFNAPGLQVLNVGALHDGSTPGGYDMATISRFLSKSQCSLRSLAVTDNELQPGQLLTFLSDPLIAKIPVVEMSTRRLPDNIKKLVNEVIETHPGARPVDIVPSPRREQVFMGWNHRATYESS